MNSNERVTKSAPAAGSPQRRRAVPLAIRNRAARQKAGARNVARTTQGLTSAQRQTDPLARAPRTVANTWLRVLVPVLGSLLVHAGIVALGFATGAGEEGRAEKVEQKITIEMKEPPPLPPVPAEVERPKPEPPQMAKAPAPKRPAPTPPAEDPPPNTPPPRVVGLSLESTSQGGDGPAFAVGNTREGRTADRAADPTTVPKEAPPPGSGVGNVTATRLPSAGVRYVPARRKVEPKLRFPETLKAQGIEADVKVSLSIDATGKVTGVRILTPSPYPEFNDIAKETALAEQFDPATRDGAPIPYSLAFTYRFRLQDE